jgi:hypothetical protein
MKKTKSTQNSADSNLRPILHTFGYILAITLVSAYQLKPYLSGHLIGDPFDGRLMVVLHEHWVNFFKGNHKLYETGFFFPYEYGLGFSDAFIFQGLLYSVLRIIIPDMLTSWSLTNSLMLVIGNIGLFLIARQIIRSYFMRIILILTAGSSFTFISYFYMYTNVNGYILLIYISLILIRMSRALKEENVKAFSVNFVALSILTPLLMLSGWYAAFYFYLYISIYIIIKLISDRKDFINKIVISFKLIYRSYRFAGIVMFSALSVFWASIYFPVSGQVDRNKKEILEGSPSLNSFLNSNYFGGGILNFINEKLSISQLETLDQSSIGLTFSVIFAWLFSGIVIIFSSHFKEIKLIWVSATLSVLIFIKFDGKSLFTFFFEYLPILGSIRAPARFLSIFAVLNIIIFIFILDSMLQKRKYGLATSTLNFIILSILLLDQIRVGYPIWTREDYEDNRFIQHYSKIKDNCSSFYLNSEGFEWWDDQLNGMLISAKLGIPTTNGYSGGFPDTYPNQSWRSKSNLLNIGNWLEKYDATKGSCILRSTGVEKFDEPLFIESATGFDLIENFERYTWRWSTEKSSSYKLINYSNKEVKGDLLFSVSPAKCMDNLNLKIEYQNFSQVLPFNSGDTKSVKIQVKVQPNSEDLLSFNVDKDPCVVGNDPRKLTFNVIDARFINK